MVTELKRLKKLSDGKVNMMEYFGSEEDQWKDGNIAMLTSSLAPEFIKAIIKHKKIRVYNQEKGSTYNSS
jgi:hypothetical protein